MLSPLFIRPIILSLVVIGTSSHALAGLVISFTPSTTFVEVPPNESASFTIDVQLAADAQAGTQSLTTYDIPIDIREPSGQGLPTGWTIVSVDEVLSLGGSFNGSIIPDGGDLRAVGTVDLQAPSPVDFTTNPQTLFRFTVEVASDGEVGEFSAHFFDGNILGFTDGEFDEISLEEVDFSDSATIHVLAVPEPAVGVILGPLLCGLVWIRRRGDG
jgi:hypothetical protein